MPVKRRAGKRRADLPIALQMLLEGQIDIENTPENHRSIVGLVYFGEFSELYDELVPAANAVLNAWRPGTTKPAEVGA